MIKNIAAVIVFGPFAAALVAGLFYAPVPTIALIVWVLALSAWLTKVLNRE